MNLHPYIYFFAAVGVLIVAGLPLGLTVWHVVDKLRFRHGDAAELHRLSGGAR